MDSIRKLEPASDTTNRQFVEVDDYDGSTLLGAVFTGMAVGSWIVTVSAAVVPSRTCASGESCAFPLAAVATAASALGITLLVLGESNQPEAPTVTPGLPDRVGPPCRRPCR